MFQNQLKKKLMQNVEHVRNVLNVLNIKQEFYIAGGSVFGILNGDKPYGDIDVYFYEEPTFLNDIENSCKNIKSIDFYGSTKYADTICITGELNEIKSTSLNMYPILSQHDVSIIQFIKYNYGVSRDVFKEFDINHSKFAVTESAEIISDCSLDDDIQINLKMYSAGSYNRFNKYVSQKGSKDPADSEFIKILDFLLMDLFAELPGSYNNQKHRKLDELKSINQEHFFKYEKYIHDKIVFRYTEREMLEIFDVLKYKFRFNELNEFCDELLLYKLIFYKENIGNIKKPSGFITESRIAAIISKYPEYFI